MPRPGTLIRDLDTPPARSAPTDTGVWFVVGLADQGPQAPVAVLSMTEVAATLGSRQAYSVLWDALETFFAEGGGVAYVSRVVGPAALAASISLKDASAANTLAFIARYVGLYANGLSAQVAVPNAGQFQLVITQGGAVVESSPVFADKPSAVAWQSATGVVSDLGGTTLPIAAAAAPLAGGTDDRASIGDAQWATALNRFTADLGPGQVSYPGRATTQGYANLLTHAQARNRFALLDVADTTNVATLLSAAATVRSVAPPQGVSDAPARFGMLVGPWGFIPGLAPNTTREVPFSAVQAGLMAESDTVQSPNVPAAGVNGQSSYLTGLNAAFDDPTHDQLAAAGVNIAKTIYGSIRAYGYRTAVDPILDANRLLASNARLRMAIFAKGNVTLENHAFAEMDGQGIEFTKLERDLTGVLLPYFSDGSLYGTKPSEAFSVDIGPSVNTIASIARNELHATVKYRPSPFAELVQLDLYKTPITQEV